MKKQQPSLFDFEDRQKLLDRYSDPLKTLDKYIDWESFRAVVMTAFPVVDYSKGGRPPYDKLMLFKVLIIQRLYDLSDAQAEFQIVDRLTFMRFLSLKYYNNVPDQNTIRGFREALMEQGVLDELFEAFNKRLESAGLVSKKGSMVDASFVTAPKQRNTRDENGQVKKGITPSEWSEKKKRHKDVDATWTKKGNETYFGYKNHVKVDIGSKLITNFETTAASVHDSEVLLELLGPEDEGKLLYADSAYRSKDYEAALTEKGIISQVHEKGYMNNPLNEEQKENNRMKSKVRARVEHVFGWMHRQGHEIHVRTVGLQRATARITLLNLVYNMTRAIQIIQAGRREIAML
jgi:IS5 family transposase